MLAAGCLARLAGLVAWALLLSPREQGSLYLLARVLPPLGFGFYTYTHYMATCIVRTQRGPATPIQLHESHPPYSCIVEKLILDVAVHNYPHSQ